MNETNRDNIIDLMNEVTRLKEEIERLRHEKADILAAKEIVFAPPAIPESFVIQELQKANVALHSDIARLQNALATADEMRRADEAEIERLRAYIAEIEGRPVLKSEWELQQAEIDRLRGLLRGALRIDAGDFSVNVDGWIKRVREALGEKP